MNQKEYIQSLIDTSKEQSDKSKKVQRAYLNCIDDDTEFTELINLMDTYCVPWVRKQLWKTGCYSDETEFTILQEARIGVWNSIVNDRKTGCIREEFVSYAFGIYKNKALDNIRKFSAKRAKLNISSLDSYEENNETSAIDKIAFTKPYTYEDDEKAEMYKKVFHTYCSAFMNSPAFPPRILALYYARVLPHLLMEIPDTKASSAKWAFERMKEKTIEELKSDSERTIQLEIAKDLCWCDDFINQMNEEIDIENKRMYLRNVVYTFVYNKGKIEDWADSMHKSAAKSAMNKIIKEPYLLNLIKEHISEKDILYRFAGGGKRK